MCLLAGVPIGYSTPTTLTDTSSKIKRGCKGDASVLKPTAMTTVPVSIDLVFISFRLFVLSMNCEYPQLILDRITKGIYDQVEKGTPFQKAFFKFAYDYKKKWVQEAMKLQF